MDEDDGMDGTLTAAIALMRGNGRGLHRVVGVGEKHPKRNDLNPSVNQVRKAIENGVLNILGKKNANRNDGR